MLMHVLWSLMGYRKKLSFQLVNSCAVQQLPSLLTLLKVREKLYPDQSVTFMILLVARSPKRLGY